ncbi:Glyoxalase/Bleomycin resistance protein/Dioxygenase superfamily protein [Thermomonospora echinospora]|uniref:Glyoxalase/Bleomycin resistance protein/Dioxygenase superfamily protein n=1 Tax=Thermomonospora echinospora TaxID=1992 RepID=A0A1H5U132_9ACTN|nr:VOC family protein [Thermomonospora echinospora]SEF68746.1 Glyoxalase/Bleomycin resistance protein/Dioxygenase superfamily protein [Thermomonospora echinospora]
MGDTGREPLIESVTSAVVGVTDFGPHLDLFCGELGFEVAAEGVVEAADAARLWGAGLGDVEVRLLTAAGSATGRVHLLKVNGPVAPAEHPHTLDVGLAGLNLYTRDIDASYVRLTAAGHPWISRPARYEVPLGEAVVSVTEGYCLGPDGLGLVFVQPANARGTQAWRTDPERHYTELTSVVAHVPDFEAELAFWGPAGLGLSAWYDVTFSSPGIEEMAALPEGTVLRLAFVASAEGGSTRIELTRVESGHRGVDRRGVQRPAHGLGHTGWSVRTEDVDAAVERVAATGGQVVRPPSEVSTPLHGRARVVAVETPNGISVELWQTL